LVPGRFAIETERLERLERALAAFARLPNGVAGLCAELRRRLGEGGTLSAKLQAETSAPRGGWQRRMISYLAAMIEGMYQDMTKGVDDGGTLHGRQTDAGGDQGAARRELRPTGRRLPAYPRTEASAGGYVPWE
jgi:hypothetical protein